MAGAFTLFNIWIVNLEKKRSLFSVGVELLGYSVAGSANLNCAPRLHSFRWLNLFRASHEIYLSIDCEREDTSVNIFS